MNVTIKFENGPLLKECVWTWRTTVKCANWFIGKKQFLFHSSRIHSQEQDHCYISKSMWVILILMLMAKAIAPTIYIFVCAVHMQYAMAEIVYAAVASHHTRNCIQYLKSLYEWKLHFKCSVMCWCEWWKEERKRRKVIEMANERARKHTRNKMCGIRIYLMHSSRKRVASLKEHFLEPARIKVKVRVKNFFPSTFTKAKETDGMYGKMWTKSKELNVERGTYSQTEECSIRQPFLFQTFSKCNFILLTQSRAKPKHIFVFFSLSLSLISFTEKKNESFTQFLPLLLFLYYISNYGRIREHVLSRQTRKSKMY